MARTSKLLALAGAIWLVAAGGLGATPIEPKSTNPTSLHAPEGFSPGLWSGLPEEDRRAILGEPYPLRFAAAQGSVGGNDVGLAPPSSDDYACWPPSPLPKAC